jgi:hypothetical protein
MYKQTSFLIAAAVLVAAVVTVALYNVNVANAQGNMSTAGKAMVAGKVGNMTSGNMTGAAKNMTGNMSSAGKAMNKTG